MDVKVEGENAVLQQTKAIENKEHKLQTCEMTGTEGNLIRNKGMTDLSTILLFLSKKHENDID